MPESGWLLGAPARMRATRSGFAKTNLPIETGIPLPSKADLSAYALSRARAIQACRVRLSVSYSCCAPNRRKRRLVDHSLTSPDPSQDSYQPPSSCRAAASAVSSGRVLKAIVAFGAAFPDWSIPPVDVNIVFASKRELSPNVRAFVDLAVAGRFPITIGRTASLSDAIALIGDLEAGNRVPGKAIIAME